MNPEFPTQGRLAGIDFGTVRIGVAISDRDQSLASPLENYDRRNRSLDERFFKELVDQERVVGFVVGLPIHMSGQESKKSAEARNFGKWLTDVTGCPVCFFDERFSSAQAEQQLLAAGLTSKQRKKRLDMLAAQILLAGYLESTRRTENNESLDD